MSGPRRAALSCLGTMARSWQQFRQPQRGNPFDLRAGGGEFGRAVIVECGCGNAARMLSLVLSAHRDDEGGSRVFRHRPRSAAGRWRVLRRSGHRGPRWIALPSTQQSAAWRRPVCPQGPGARAKTCIRAYRTARPETPRRHGIGQPPWRCHARGQVQAHGRLRPPKANVHRCRRIWR